MAVYIWMLHTQHGFVINFFLISAGSAPIDGNGAIIINDNVNKTLNIFFLILLHFYTAGGKGFDLLQEYGCVLF